MTEPMPPETRVLTASILGTWTPLNLPPIDADNYEQIQAATTPALTTALGLTGPTLDFNLVGNDQPGGTLYRSRWIIDYTLGGPGLQHGDSPHPSIITLVIRHYPPSYTRQFALDNAQPGLLHKGVLSAAVPAYILRHHFGNDPRTLTLGSFGNGTFTPEILRYRSLENGAMIDHPWNADLRTAPGYPHWKGNDGRPPGMWLTTNTSPAVGWQISYCVTEPTGTIAERWDIDPLPVPDFVPLDWPD